jgi:hypothetical protein
VVRINDKKTGRAGWRWFGELADRDSLAGKRGFYISNILEGINGFARFIPAGMKGEDIAGKHSLEKADERMPVFHDQVKFGRSPPMAEKPSFS